MKTFKLLSSNEKYLKVMAKRYNESINKHYQLDINFIDKNSLIYITNDFIIIKNIKDKKVVFNVPIVKSFNNLLKSLEFIIHYSKKLTFPFIIINFKKSFLDDFLKDYDLPNFDIIIEDNYYHLTLKESLQLKNLYQLCFNDSPKYIDYYFEEKVNKLTSKTKVLDNIIVSSLYLKPQTIIYHKQKIDSQILIGACTHPLYTKQGLMSSLIKETINDSFKNKISLITLNPFDKDFYERFNFVSYSFYKISESNPSKQYSFRKASFNDISILLGIYQDFSIQYDIYTFRDKNYYFEILKETSADNDEVIIISKNKTDIGYYIKINNIIEEYCSLDPKLITKQNEYIELPSNSQNTTLNMARILNPLLFLSLYPFKEKRFEGKFRIIDDIILENNIILKLEINKKTIITLASQYDFVIRIDELTNLLLNGNIDNNPHPFYQLFSNSKNLTWEKY